MSFFSNRYADGSYTESNPDLNFNESHRKAACFLKLFDSSESLVGGAENLRSVLDIGCGSGGFIFELSKIMPSVKKFVGIDLNPDAINFARSISGSPENLEFRNIGLGDVHDQFDLVTIVHVLEHIPDWEDFLLDVQKKTNLVYISVPLEASVWMSLRKNVLLNQYLKYGHIHFFNEPFLLKILQEFGFEIIRTGYSDEFLSFTGLGARLIKFPRLLLGFFSRRLACNFLGGYCLQVLCRPIK